MKHFFCVAIVLISSIGVLMTAGCKEEDRKNVAILLGGIAGSLSQSPLLQRDISFHKRFRWNAEDFFDDPQVIALCRAIEAKDLQEIDRLIAAGADANALGKDNMTPLLWAFADLFKEKNLAVFIKILEAGADPNVQITSNFGVNLGNDTSIWTGTSVMELAALVRVPGYFEAVMRHGGNPNLVSKAYEHNTPLHSIASRHSIGHINRVEQAKLLLDAGADINAVSWYGTPITRAVIGSNFDLAIFLLEAGADWEIVPDPILWRTPRTLVEEVVKYENTPFQRDNTRESYNKLVSLLKEKGAKAELDRLREENERARQTRREIDLQRARGAMAPH
jgi:ankyrin repeat protein